MRGVIIVGIAGHHDKTDPCPFAFFLQVTGKVQRTVRRYDPVIDELLDVTDLVMLDLKQMNDDVHQILVGVSNHRTLDFARYLQKKGKRTWIRFVVVPG